jgi:drug/metabolite transporter (DMT)-like permease
VWGALLIVYIVWGSTYLAIRITVETLPPMLSAGVRFLVAGVVLGTILAVRGGIRRLRVTCRQLAASALIGALLVVGGNGGVVYAESGPPGEAVPSGVAALLIALVPLLVVLMRALFHDRPPLVTFVGVAVGFGGLTVLVVAGAGVGGEIPLAGALLVVAAATSWAIGSFASRRVPLPADAFVATVYESLAGGAILTLLGVLRGESLQIDQVSTRSWLGLAYLIIAGSLLAFTAYVWLLHNAPISLTATYAYVNPAVAVALGALIVNEPVTPAILVGGLVIIMGVALVVSTERPRAPVASGE